MISYDTDSDCCVCVWFRSEGELLPVGINIAAVIIAFY